MGAGLSLCLLGPGAWAAEGAAACAAEAGDQARLACYDRLFRAAPAAPVAPQAGRPATLQPDRAAADGMLTERWGLGEEADRRLFRIHAHRPTYILPVRWSNAPNHQPTSPNPDNQVASPDSLKAAEATIPLGRGGTPEEAAGAVYMFCIPESNYVSGQVLVCGGGRP